MDNNVPTIRLRQDSSKGTDNVTPLRDAGAQRQQLRFNTASLKSSYCNMCNATSTREEVVLNFGLNQNWDHRGKTPEELQVDLQHRVVISPFAAKRLSAALAKLVSDYESRYGALD